MRRAAEAFCTVGFSGHIDAIPSTLFGSAAGVLLFIAAPSGLSVQLPLVLIVLALGVWASNAYCTGTGRRDPQEIVIDETCGVMVALLGTPADVPVVLFAYCAFHLFDVVKPFPIRQLQRLPGGWGVMIDDIAAGVCANLALRLVGAAGLIRL